ncbi:protein PHYTOCHROME KINASE SUBSTRATE 2-like [Salvia divinorum]|uniref:Protein PHYTOCHROME KINASE SUBSTRATE 2-like n=1 Tax=Salvia divinorum TaxID=28513 RepID=A0ABD1IM81_SALDI
MLMPVQSHRYPSKIIKNSISSAASFTPQDKEIDVFDAWKYFNDGLNHTPKICTKSLPNDHHRPKLKKDVVQTAVKEHPPVLSQRSQQHSTKTGKKSFLASIGCNCSCLTISGRSKPGNKSNDHFIKQERKRRSQFGLKGNNCFNMGTNLTMLTWGEELKIPSTSSDSDSDASSDLFEIKSFYIDNPFEPTTCFAPSIERSVVTASAADFSLLSDSDDASSTILTPCIKKSGLNAKTASFREMPKIRPSILSGCKSQKAISVAGDAQTRRRPVMTAS